MLSPPLPRAGRFLPGAATSSSDLPLLLVAGSSSAQIHLRHQARRLSALSWQIHFFFAWRSPCWRSPRSPRLESSAPPHLQARSSSPDLPLRRSICAAAPGGRRISLDLRRPASSSSPPDPRRDVASPLDLRQARRLEAIASPEIFLCPPRCCRKIFSAHRPDLQLASSVLARWSFSGSTPPVSPPPGGLHLFNIVLLCTVISTADLLLYCCDWYCYC